MPLMYYAHPLGPNTAKTPEGYLICQRVPIARTGAQEYTAGESHLPGDPGRVVTEQRDAAEVFAPETLASFEGKPVTDNHPPCDVMPDNYAAYARGHVQDVRQGTGDEAGFILADLYITDPTLIAEIENHSKREISCGYDTELIARPDGTYAQTQIRGNHVAVVPRGRAGSQVAIKDHALETPADNQPTPQRSTRMATPKTKGGKLVHGWLFRARDAKPEELADIADDIGEALDCAGTDRAPETDAAKKDAPPPANPDADADKKLIAAALTEALAPVMAAIAGLQTDVAALKAGGNADAPSDDAIGDAIKKLTADAPDTPAEVDPSADEEKVTAPPEEIDDPDDGGAMDRAARDAAVKILTQAKPAIAAMADAGERKRVTDALLAAVTSKPTTPNGVQGVVDAVQSTQQKRRADGTPAKQPTPAEMQALYNKRNPHFKG